ncbi:16S rRNA (uracil1498-N3)-methyltransferase [Neisseria sp. HSC-16F19]|nr:16S rRNA (uracil(1498)-N(3))-methyltransferase [Neisseria sp. HSC-16F19]MCP2041392.1 16S rRNA (uracil1498-N3)-methyltransferase [Neisseria sp. HSC-16F19]
MPRFYVSTPLIPHTACTLPENVARHVQVLRAQPGDALELFDGSGQVFEATVAAMGKKQVSVRIGAARAHSVESPLAVTLLQSVSASERMDLTVQKCVELGVTRIVPLMSERSSQRLSGERADKRVARWQDIAIAACEQCGRTVLPEIAAVADWHSALAALPQEGSRWLLSTRQAQALPALAAPQSVCLLVGPEGGFSAAEEEMAVHDFGFTPVSLGPRVLRTETAGVAALAAMQVLWGDFR